jgi:hypothetical protein
MARAYIYAFLAGIAATAFYFYVVPPHHILRAVPEVLLVITLSLPLLAWQSVADSRRRAKIAGLGSCAIWVLGIIVSLIIKPDNELIYIPDALLLTGFVPLLYAWRFSWPWLVFGGFNFAIGIFLQLLAYIPDHFFPADLVYWKHHLAEYHPPIAWWIFGLFTIMFGVARLAKNLVKKARSS